MYERAGKFKVKSEGQTLESSLTFQIVWLWCLAFRFDLELDHYFIGGLRLSLYTTYIDFNNYYLNEDMYPAGVASLASRMIYMPVNIWQRDILAAQGQPDLFPDEFEILVSHNNN